MDTQTVTTLIDQLESLIDSTCLTFETEEKPPIVTHDCLENIVDRLATMYYDYIGYDNAAASRSLYRAIREISSNNTVCDYIDQTIGLSLVDSRGKFIKRLANQLKHDLNWKLSNDQLGYLGGLISRYSHAYDSYFDLTNDFDWRRGQFGDDGSCFWGCREYSRQLMLDNGCLALRLWDKPPNSDYEGGTGRCWVWPAPKHNGVILFNAYGLSQVQCLADNLATWFEREYGQTVYVCTIGFRVEGSADSPLWINGGTGVLISTREYPRLKSLNITHIDDNACEESHNTETCNSCGYEYDQDELTEVHGYLYCHDCVWCCNHCDDYYTMDIPYHTVSWHRYCDDCFHNLGYGTCDNCDSTILVARAHEINGDILCDYCYTVVITERENEANQ